MKKRLHDKKAGIALLITLIVISCAEMIFRAIALGKAVLTTSNAGEQVAVVVFAAMILVMTLKGKDRLCYICYGAWASYFVLDQSLEIPGIMSSMASWILHTEEAFAIPYIIAITRIFSMFFIVTIGIFLIEYMNDGTICNRAFNGICISAIALILVGIVTAAIGAAVTKDSKLWLESFNGLYRIAMIFMLTFFAYDSAKHQLKKATLKN